MKCVTICLLWFIYFSVIDSSEANDYSSFLSANASLAVVIDHDYMLQRGENIMGSFQKIFDDIIRENLKNGGVNIKYFTWNAVRLKKDFFAAITVTDCKNTWNFYQATQANSIFLIAITDGNCPRLPLNRALMLPMVEKGEEFIQIIFDIKAQNMLKWKTAIMLIDQTVLNENPLMVESLVYENTKNHIPPISILLYKIDDTLRGQKKRQALRQILQPYAHHPSERYQFIVISKFYEDIIEVGDNMDLFHTYSQWLFFVIEETRRDFDAVQVTQNLGEGINIAFVLNETITGCQDTINCTLSEISMAFVTSLSRIITEEQSIYGEISDEEWESIRFTKQEKQDELLNYMQDYLKVNSKCASCARLRIETAITWGRNRDHNKYQLNEGDAKETNKLYFTNIGYWTPILGFVTQELIFPHIEQHFRNTTLDIITVHNPPWQILKKDQRGAIIEHSGITMELLKELSRMLNFTYKLHEIRTQEETDEYVINQNETEPLIGSMTHTIPYKVIEAISKRGNQFFLAAVAVTIDEPDKKNFNYTLPISVQKYSFIYKRPDEVSRIYLFTAPFTLETWACLTAVLLITAPVLYVINRLAPMQNLRVDGLCKMKNCFWYVYGALLQQGGMYLPKADSGRLVVGIWWIVVIVLVTTYCGNLVAFLTFPKYQQGVDYIFQAFKENYITQFGLRNGTFFEKYAVTSTRADFHKYMQRAIIYNDTQGENIDAVKRGNRINIDWRINLQLVIQKQFEADKECKFSLSKEDFVDEQIGLMMPNNSPYLHLINQQITRLFHMGFIERWHQTNLPSMDKCNGKSILRQITNHKVNLEDMQGCFLVLLFGFMVALLLIFIEFWFYHFYSLDKKMKKSFSS